MIKIISIKIQRKSFKIQKANIKNYSEILKINVNNQKNIKKCMNNKLIDNDKLN